MSKIIRAVVGVIAIVVGAMTGQYWLIGLGVSLEYGVIQEMLAPKAGSISGFQTQVTVDPTTPRRLLVGEVMTPGSLGSEYLTHDKRPWAMTDEGKNRVLECIIPIADHEIDSFLLDGFYVNNVKQTLLEDLYDSDWGYPTEEYLGHPGKYCCWVKFFTGADGQDVDPHLTECLGDRWNSTAVGTNVAYARVSCIVDEDGKFWGGGLPDFKFVIHGAPLYDQRKDSTAGGSGAHRWGVPSTYEWSENASVIAHNILKGIYVGGELFYGLPDGVANFRASEIIAAHNACDEAITLKAGGTEKRYTIGAEIPVNRAPADVLTAIKTSFAGRILEVGGTWRILPGVAYTPVAYVTDSDIMIEEDRQYDPKRSVENLVNRVVGTFIDPAQNYSQASFPARVSTDDVEEDADFTLTQELTLDFITSGARAQRVAEIWRKRGRLQTLHNTVFRPSAIVLEPGDWFAWTSARWGYEMRVFEVENADYASNLNTRLIYREVNGDIDAWDPDTDELPITGGLLPSADPEPLEVTNLTLSPITVTGANGTVSPGVQYTWDPSGDPSAGEIIIEYRPVGSTDPGQTTPPVPDENGDDGGVVAGTLLPATEYEMRAVYLAAQGRQTVWSDWVTITTPADQSLGIGVDPLSILILQALSPIRDVRQAVADAVFLPWLDSLDATFASVANAIADLQNLTGVVRDAQIIRDPVSGIVTIFAVDAVSDDLQDYKTTVTATFDAVNAEISLRVTHDELTAGLASVIAGFDPTYRWEYDSDAAGWTGHNATLAASASLLTVTDTGASPYIQSPAISFDAGANKFVQIKIIRTAGSTWGMSLIWGGSWQFSQAVVAPTDPTIWNTLQIDLSSNADWTGTLTALRIAFGDASTVYEIDYIAIGENVLQSLVIGDLQDTITVLSAEVDVLAGDVALKASQASLDALGAIVSDVEVDVDANTAAILLKASQASLDATNATLATAQVTISAQTLQIQSVLSWAGANVQGGQAVTIQQAAADFAGALAAMIQQMDSVKANLAYARQGLYVDLLGETSQRVSSVLQLQSQTQDNAALILQVISAYTSADSAEVTNRIAGDASIQAQIGGGFSAGSTVTAQFASEQTARASGDSANATDITALQASLATTNTATAANATAISALTVTVTAQGTSITSISSSLTSLTSTVSGHTASITTLNTTVATQGTSISSLSSSLTTLTSTVGGHTTSISTLTTAVNGLEAQWGVYIDVNGRVTGLIQLDSSNNESNFVVVADHFKIFDGASTETAAFVIEGGLVKLNVPLKAGTITADQIFAGTITANELAGGAATNTRYQTKVGGVGVNDTTYAGLVEFASNVNDGSPIEINVSGYIEGQRNSGTKDGRIWARVFRSINSAKKTPGTFAGAEWGMQSGGALYKAAIDAATDGWTQINSSTVTTNSEYLQVTKNYGGGGSGLTTMGISKTSMGLTYTKCRIRFSFLEGAHSGTASMGLKITFGSTVVYNNGNLAFNGLGNFVMADYDLTLTSPPGGTGTIKIEFLDQGGTGLPGFYGGTDTVKITELIFGIGDSEISLVGEAATMRTIGTGRLNSQFGLTFIDPAPPTSGTNKYVSYAVYLVYVKINDTDEHYGSSWAGDFNPIVARDFTLIANQIKR